MFNTYDGPIGLKRVSNKLPQQLKKILVLIEIKH
jgi:hypothetical protein